MRHLLQHQINITYQPVVFNYKYYIANELYDKIENYHYHKLFFQVQRSKRKHISHCISQWTIFKNSMYIRFWNYLSTCGLIVYLIYYKSLVKGL